MDMEKLSTIINRMTNYGKESLMRFKKQEITGLLQHLHISTTCFENFLFISFPYIFYRVSSINVFPIPSRENFALLNRNIKSEQEDNNEKFLSHYDER